MERHAPLPDREDIQWRTHVARKVVKQDIAEPPADHDAEDQKEQQVVKIISRKLKLLFAGVFLEQKVADDERQHVHQPVPTKLDRAETQEHGIDVRKSELQDHE